MYCFTVSVHQESGYRLAGSFAQGITRATVSSGLQVLSQTYQVLAETSSLWLENWNSNSWRPGGPSHSVAVYFLMMNRRIFLTLGKPEHFLFFRDFIYLFMRDTQREAETQAEEEAGSLWGAQCGTWSQDPRIMTWAQVPQPLSHPGAPWGWFLMYSSDIQFPL